RNRLTRTIMLLPVVPFTAPAAGLVSLTASASVKGQFGRVRTPGESAWVAELHSPTASKAQTLAGQDLLRGTAPGLAPSRERGHPARGGLGRAMGEETGGLLGAGLKRVLDALGDALGGVTTGSVVGDPHAWSLKATAPAGLRTNVTVMIQRAAATTSGRRL